MVNYQDILNYIFPCCRKKLNAQQWLESQEEYNTKQKRAWATELLITDQLTGTLDLTDFTKLKEIFITWQVDASQFAITNQPVGVKIITNSWIDIDEEFGSYYQQNWEKAGLTAQDAQAWIKVGFELYQLSYIQNWKNLNFTADQAQEWINIGLKTHDYELAYYCQTKQLTPQVVEDNLEKYKTELKQKLAQELQSAQSYFDFFYPLANRSKIKRLNISDKNLNGDLNLTGFNNLTEFNCYNNNLTNLNFLNTLPHPEKLTKLDISWNNITSNLTPLSKLVNLRELDLGLNTSLATSLAPLQHCLKLEILGVYDTKLAPDLQYLPLSLSEIRRNGKIAEELKIYSNNLTAWQAAHPELMKEAGKKKVIDNQDYSKSELKTITTTPEELVEHLKSATEPVTNYQLTKFNYLQFALRDGRPLPWENEKLEKVTAFPLRLYNLETKEVEETKDRKDIPHYLALSYVWGTDWENKRQKYGQDYETDLTQLGRKALNKVLATEKLINKGQTPINHIWIDNFCINQGDKTEKGNEVKKQQQYYNNASATLIAIDGSVGEAKWESEREFTQHITKQIVASPWFQRSWTFQEGLLSKQTIFLFDDKIVDGRILANYWGGVQEGSSSNLKSTPTIFITPLGWSAGAQPNQKVELGLSQALHAVSHRQQTVPLDSIYSILGLLPYGNKVQTNYQPFGHQYTQEELNTELKKIMELAMANGSPYEILSWTGVRNSVPELWMIPPLKEDGSSEITGFMEFKPNSSNKFSATGWEFIGSKELVKKDNEETGSKVGDITIYPNLKQIKSNKLKITLPIANKATRPIVFRNEVGNSYDNKKFFLDMVNKEVIKGEELIKQYQQQLPLIQQQNQSFSLVYDGWGDNVTVNNSLVWQSQEQFYIVVDEQLQAIDNLWKTRIHSAFADPALIRAWTNQHWTYGLVQMWAGWLKDKFNPHDYAFYTWVRDAKELRWWEVEEQENELRTEFQTYQTEQLVAQMEISPK